jgi:hypothetical protein
MAGQVGGKRRGAGRPKGSKSKMTLVREAAMRARGITSLDFLQETYADASQPMHIRINAATSALPYEYSKKPIEARIEASQAVHVQIVDFTAATVLAELDGKDPDMIDVTPTNGSTGSAEPSTEANPVESSAVKPTMEDLLQ